MSEKIIDTEIVAEAEYIYFCKKEENGKLSVYKAKRGRKKKQN